VGRFVANAGKVGGCQEVCLCLKLENNSGAIAEWFVAETEAKLALSSKVLTKVDVLH
jgi:hypothetical protein